MRRIIASYQILDEIYLLRRSVRCLKNKGVDYVVVVHGAWRGFTSPLKLDGRCDAIHSVLTQFGFRDAHSIFYEPEWDMLEMMSARFRVGREGDWLLLLDTDEFLISPVEIPDPNMPVAYLQFFEGTTGLMDARPRLFRWQRGLHYEDSHMRVVNGAGEVVDAGVPVDGNFTSSPTVIVHLPDLHTQAYEVLRARWKRSGLLK